MPFQLYIDNIDDFIALVAIIRSENLDDETLKRLTVDLSKSTAALIEAEKNDQSTGG